MVDAVANSVSDENASEDDGYSMWSRPFNFAGQNVRVEEGWGIGIGGTVWEGGVLLAQYLSSSAFDASRFHGARCIELGAGATGLPGIVAAQLGCFSQVVITDVDECLEALHENVAANLPAHCSLVPSCLSQGQTATASVPQTPLQLAPQPVSATAAMSGSAPVAASSQQTDPAAFLNRCNHGQEAAEAPVAMQEPSAHIWEEDPSLDNAAAVQQDSHQTAKDHTEVLTAELDWGQDASHVAPPFDVVLIADVVYVPEAMQSLLKCIRSVATPESTILFAKYKRFAPASEQFWKLLPDYFDAEKIPEAQFGAKSQEDAIGIFKLTCRSDKTI